MLVARRILPVIMRTPVWNSLSHCQLRSDCALAILSSQSTVIGGQEAAATVDKRNRELFKGSKHNTDA